DATWTRVVSRRWYSGDALRYRRAVSVRCVPRCTRPRGCSFSEPADHPLLAVLERIHHARCTLVDVRRSGHLNRSDSRVAGAVGCRLLLLPRRRSGAVSTNQPRQTLDPALTPARIARFADTASPKRYP